MAPERPVLHALLGICLCFTNVGLILAQQTSASSIEAEPRSTAPQLSVDARLVNLPVVVRDRRGTLLRSLSKADFDLRVDGHPQVIRYFDIDSNLPLVLGLLVDTSLSQRSVIDEERSASGAFLNQMLTNPKDQAFVIQFARQVELLGDLTNSHSKLEAALKEIGSQGSDSGSEPDNTGSGAGSSRSRRRTYAGGTTLYDAAFLASDELMKKQTGRKALVILSDGVDRGSKETLEKALEATQRADTVIYAIYFKGEQPSQQSDWGRRGGMGRFPGGGYPGGRGGGYPGGGGYPSGQGGGQESQANHIDGKKILRQLAEETGGSLFEVSKKQTVSQIYDRIAQELRMQYRLGFTPDSSVIGDGYHQIDLTTHNKDLSVQTRDGYYLGK